MTDPIRIPMFDRSDAAGIPVPYVRLDPEHIRAIANAIAQDPEAARGIVAAAQLPRITEWDDGKPKDYMAILPTPTPAAAGDEAAVAAIMDIDPIIKRNLASDILSAIHAAPQKFIPAAFHINHSHENTMRLYDECVTEKGKWTKRCLQAENEADMLKRELADAQSGMARLRAELVEAQTYRQAGHDEALRDNIRLRAELAAEKERRIKVQRDAWDTVYAVGLACGLPPLPDPQAPDALRELPPEWRGKCSDQVRGIVAERDTATSRVAELERELESIHAMFVTDPDDDDTMGAIKVHQQNLKDAMDRADKQHCRADAATARLAQVERDLGHITSLCDAEPWVQISKRHCADGVQRWSVRACGRQLEPAETADTVPAACALVLSRLAKPEGES